ncbi:hypothetical protein HA44_04115 [Mixta gaviniae]|nr:hypothetical protein HA44_04115 [Mixta gaviniae]
MFALPFSHTRHNLLSATSLSGCFRERHRRLDTLQTRQTIQFLFDIEQLDVSDSLSRQLII